MKETMPRLIAKLTAKSKTPSSTLCRVIIAKIKISIPRSFPSFLIDFAALGHQRIHDFSHDGLRNCGKLKVGINCNFPKLVKTLCSGTLQRISLDQQINDIRGLHDARFHALALFIVVVKLLVFSFAWAGANNICEGSTFRELPRLGAKI